MGMLLFALLFPFCSLSAVTATSIYLLASSSWDLAFRHSLDPAELGMWHRLGTVFSVLSDGMDSIVWPLSSSGTFSVKSLYHKLSLGSATNSFRCGKRGFLSRSRFSYDKLLGVNYQLLIKFRSVIQGLPPVFSLLQAWRLWAHSTFFFLMTLQSCCGVVLYLGLGWIGPILFHPFVSSC